jgi:hypothetical protein
MRVNVLMYIEDDALTVGLRSKSPSTECGLFDGESYFNYYIVDADDEIMGMDIVKIDQKTFEVYVDDLLIDVITDGDSSSFSIDV